MMIVISERQAIVLTPAVCRVFLGRSSKSGEFCIYGQIPQDERLLCLVSGLSEAEGLALLDRVLVAWAQGRRSIDVRRQAGLFAHAPEAPRKEKPVAEANRYGRRHRKPGCGTGVSRRKGREGDRWKSVR